MANEMYPTGSPMGYPTNPAMQPRPGMPPQPGAMPPGATMPPGAPGVPGAAAPGADPYAGMDPQTVAGMMKLQQQMMLANRLRAGAPAMGQSQSPIQTPNYAGTLAGVLSNYKAGKVEDESSDTLKKYFAARVGADAAR